MEGAEGYRILERLDVPMNEKHYCVQVNVPIDDGAELGGTKKDHWRNLSIRSTFDGAESFLRDYMEMKDIPLAEPVYYDIEGKKITCNS